MALQLLKRNYVMEGYERPKILKLPQGEMRWSPTAPKVDVGDVMMNIRLNNGKNRFIQEHVSKYSQGLNPYGEWGQPYKINKNNIRPPIVDPKFYEPLSRMPVKFDSITAGPIVKDLYGKKIAIGEAFSKKLITQRVCPDAGTNASLSIEPTNTQSRAKDLYLKQPRATIPYHPSIPVHNAVLGTGVPSVELDPAFIVRPNMGIHAPYNISDQSRDVRNMRTPTHIAMNPNLQIPGATLDNNYLRQGPDLTPKIQTAAWYNPSYNLTENSGFGISNMPDQKCLQSALHVAGQTNLSGLTEEAERGVTKLNDIIHPGSFEGKAYRSQIDDHPTFTRIPSMKTESHRENFTDRFQTSYDGSTSMNQHYNNAMNSRAIKTNLPKAHGELQETRTDRSYLGDSNF